MDAIVKALDATSTKGARGCSTHCGPVMGRLSNKYERRCMMPAWLNTAARCSKHSMSELCFGLPHNEDVRGCAQETAQDAAGSQGKARRQSVSGVKESCVANPLHLKAILFEHT